MPTVTNRKKNLSIHHKINSWQTTKIHLVMSFTPYNCLVSIRFALSYVFFVLVNGVTEKFCMTRYSQMNRDVLRFKPWRRWGTTCGALSRNSFTRLNEISQSRGWCCACLGKCVLANYTCIGADIRREIRAFSKR